MSDNSSARFRIILSEQQRQELRRLGKKTVTLGTAKAYLRDLQAIYAHLTTNPTEWGEPTHALPHSGMLVYHKVLETLSIHYAVNTERRIVFPSQLMPLPRHPLGQGE